MGLVQAIPSQLNNLVVSETEHPICQGEHVVRGVAGDDVRQTVFHLRGGLFGEDVHTQV